MLKRTMILGASLMLLLIAPAMTQADSHGGDDVAALKAQVAQLEARVSQLESLKPTFTAFMPGFSERFHVLHIAGDAGDWQVANHELAEMERLVSVSSAIDSEKGKLLATFIDGDLHEIQEAIEHGNRKKFDTALKQTVKNCNACHKAVGSPFIQISLDVPPNLSLRHPHIFTASKAEGMEHHH